MRSVPIEEVMALTGLTKRQVLRLTREGRIPAAIVSGRFVMTPAQRDQLNHEGVRPTQPTPADNPLAPSQFIRKVS